MTEPARKPYRLVFFGTSEFAVPALERLFTDKDFDVRLAVTQPDRPAGRKAVMTAPPVKQAALVRKLPVWQPESLKGEGAAEKLADESPSVFVVAAYGKILPKRLLEIPAFGAINIHGSLLPKHRGASPVAAAIAAGDQETGVTIMKMDEKMDTGPILASRTDTIREDDTSAALEKRLAALGAELLVPTLKLYLEGHLEPAAQDESRASATKVMTRDDGRLDWSKGAEDIERFVRAMAPWPEAWTVLGAGKERTRLTVKKASVLHPKVSCAECGGPGSVFRLNDGRMAVNCGAGSMIIERLQPAGKNEMGGAAFLNGYPGAAGSRLG